MRKHSCDFCSDEPAEFIVPVDDFVLNNIESKGNWLACLECAGLLNADAWSEIVLRSVLSWKDKVPFDIEELRIKANRVYAAILVNRNGKIRHLGWTEQDQYGSLYVWRNQSVTSVQRSQ